MHFYVKIERDILWLYSINVFYILNYVQHYFISIIDCLKWILQWTKSRCSCY